jgi:HTH-type transcriptional regulator/antitoxin HipB
MLVHNARELGLRMRDQRRDLGLSQAALAKQIGVARAWVIRVERGNAGAEIGLVLKAVEALGLDLDVRAAAGPAVQLADGGEAWTPDLAEILERARGTKP